jgi:hypothetical protein
MNEKEKKWSDNLDKIASNLSKEFESSEYKFYSETDGCKVYQKHTNAFVRWKSICEMNFSAKDIMDHFCTEDVNLKKQYDTDVAEKNNFKVCPNLIRTHDFFSPSTPLTNSPMQNTTLHL